MLEQMGYVAMEEYEEIVVLQSCCMMIRGFTDEKRVYNYCHCRACRISENLFGIISNRWRVLQATILLPPESVKNVVMAILVLHNHL